MKAQIEKLTAEFLRNIIDAVIAEVKVNGSIPEVNLSPQARAEGATRKAARPRRAKPSVTAG